MGAARVWADFSKASDVAEYHRDAESALRDYFSAGNSVTPARLVSLTIVEVKELLDRRLRELETSSSLMLLTSLEAALRIDFRLRVGARKRDELSKTLRLLHKKNPTSVCLEEILDIWRSSRPELSKLVSEIKGLLHYRHWLAHGRHYWPKFGRQFDYFEVFEIVREVSNRFDLILTV